MAIGNVMQTGRSGMMVANAAVATSGHNISNANTEGYSRQRVLSKAQEPRHAGGSQAMVGQGALISRIERLNDDYIEKQVRNVGRELAHMEEKDVVLRQTEDIFNEMHGDGLSRLVTRFFNEFRKLANDPDSEALRQSVREASQALINDFRRIRKDVDEVRRHIDARIEGAVSEFNALADEVKDLNLKIKVIETSGAVPNDLLDRRDAVLRKLGGYVDLSMHKNDEGQYVIDIKGIGPLVTGGLTEKFFVERSPADDQGKPENAFDLKTTASASSVVTHRIKTGKLGGLLEVRDQTCSTIMQRMDEMAHAMVASVNEIHQQGFNRHGVQGLNFFKRLDHVDRAAEFIDLSDEVQSSVNNIATAAIPDAPGDNRIALAISGLQGRRLLDEGKATIDDWYNSIVSDVGVAAGRNAAGLGQQKNMLTQLNKMRDQISGVSIDEETANLLQYQHLFGASAKVIQVADDMLNTVLNLKR